MKESKFGDAAPYFSLLLKVGLTMVLNIAVFFSIGLVIDRKFNLKGIPIFIGVFLGVGIGFYYVFREIKKLK